MAKPTMDDLVARARDMVPVLRGRAGRAEALRRIPDETVAEFQAAGFYRIFQPERHDGYELDYGSQLAIFGELGRGCASSAWDGSVIGCHAWILGMFPPQAQDEVWGEEPATLVATAFMGIDPQVRAADGGLEIGGRWKFSSGIDHCDWIIVMIGVASKDGEGSPERAFALVPLADCVVEDTWHAAGLAATGSNDVVIEAAFVPDHRWVRISDLRGGPTAGSAVNPGHLYRLPLFAVFSYSVLAAGFGAARGMLDCVVAALDGGVSRSTHASVGALQSAHLRIAEAAAEIDAAYALVIRDCDEFNTIAKAGEALGMDRRVRYRRDTSFAANACVRAADRLLPLLGGQGLALDSPGQRAWRDAHAVAQHIGLSWDIHGGAYGAMAMGIPPADPML